MRLECQVLRRTIFVGQTNGGPTSRSTSGSSTAPTGPGLAGASVMRRIKAGVACRGFRPSLNGRPHMGPTRIRYRINRHLKTGARPIAQLC